MRINEESAFNAFISIVAYQNDSKEFEIILPKSQRHEFIEITKRNKLIQSCDSKDGVYHVRIK